MRLIATALCLLAVTALTIHLQKTAPDDLTLLTAPPIHPHPTCTLQGVAATLRDNENFWGRWSLSYDYHSRLYVFQVTDFPGQGSKWQKQGASPNTAACRALEQILVIAENDYAHVKHNWNPKITP